MTSPDPGGANRAAAAVFAPAERGGSVSLPMSSSSMSDRIRPAPPLTTATTDSSHNAQSHQMRYSGGEHPLNTSTISARGTDSAAYHTPSQATDTSSHSGPSNAYFQPSPNNRTQPPSSMSGAGTSGQQRRPDKGRRLKPVSNAVIAAKTRLCVKYEKGTCTSPTCTFAHGSTELRKKPDLRKTKLCESFTTINSCAKGSECTYAHGVHELQATSEYFKTSICPNWKQGHCDAGAHCRHAHGTQELRVRPLVPKRAFHLHNVDFSADVPGTPESSGRFPSSPGGEEKHQPLSSESGLIVEEALLPSSPAAAHAVRSQQHRDSAIDMNIGSTKNMIGSADESGETQQQQQQITAPTQSIHVVTLPAIDHRPNSLGNNKNGQFHPLGGYSQRPSPPGTGMNRSQHGRGTNMQQTWQSNSNRGLPNKASSHNASDLSYLPLNEGVVTPEPATAATIGATSNGGSLFKTSSSSMRRSLAVSAPNPPPPPPEPDGLSSNGTILPRPPANGGYSNSGGHRHQRQISEISRGARRSQVHPQHDDVYLESRNSPSNIPTKVWAKQLPNNQQQNASLMRHQAWKSQQQQQDVQHYDHRSSSNHSRGGGGGNYGAPNPHTTTFNRSNMMAKNSSHITRPTKLTPTPNQQQQQQSAAAASVTGSHPTSPTQPLLLFVNPSRGLPSPAGLPIGGADMEALSHSQECSPPLVAAEYTPGRPPSITKLLSLSDDKSMAGDQLQQRSTVGPALPSETIPPPKAIQVNRPVLGFFPFDLPTVKESATVDVVQASPAQNPLTKEVFDGTPAASALVAPSNPKATWEICYGDRRASSIEFNPSHGIEGRFWGARASSVVYPSGTTNRRLSRQSVKEDGSSLKPAAAEAYPLAALVGKTMESATPPHRRRGTYADIPSTRATMSQSRISSPRNAPEPVESGTGGSPTRYTNSSPRGNSQMTATFRGSIDHRNASVSHPENRDLERMRSVYIHQAALLATPQSLKRVAGTSQTPELYAALPATALHTPPPIVGEPATTPPDPSHTVADGTPLPISFPPSMTTACDAFSAAMSTLPFTPFLSIFPGASTYPQQPVISPSPLVVSPAILPPWTTSGMPTRLSEGGQSYIPIAYSSPILGCNVEMPVYIGGCGTSNGATAAVTSRELTLLPFPAPAVTAQVMAHIEPLAASFVPPPPYHFGNRKGSVYEYPSEASAGVIGE